MAKQLIDIGSEAGDLTADTVRESFDICNDNFSELYGIGSPICGADEGIRAACKYFEFGAAYKGELYYVKTIIAGTYATPNRTYTVQIYKTTSLAAEGSKVMEYTLTDNVTKTGWEKLTLGAATDSSIAGFMIIDWSALTTGETYTATDFTDGGIFAFTTIPTNQSFGDELIDIITADAEAIDGSFNAYIYNHGADPGAAMTTKAVLYASIKGVMNLINISAYKLTFAGNSTEGFNGVAGSTVELAAGASMIVRPYDGDFIVTGSFTIIPPA